MDRLERLVDQLGASQKEQRDQAFVEIRSVLAKFVGTREFNKAKDKDIRDLLSRLFRLIGDERIAYVKAAKKSSRGPSDSRIDCLTGALRALVNAFVVRFRSKSLHITLEHILATIPKADDNGCPPILNPHLKCLEVILGWAPHVEHLPRTQWDDAVSFCTVALENLADDHGSQPSGSRSFVGGTAQSWTSRTSSQGRTHRPATWTARVKAVLSCLAALTRPTNAPICARPCPENPNPDRSKMILEATVGFLRDTGTATGALDGFRVVNSALKQISTSSVPLMKKTARALVPLVKSYWTTKLSGLKDELLKTFILLQPFLRQTQEEDTSDAFQYDLTALHEVLYEDYVHTEGRDRRHLQLTDLHLSTWLPANPSPFRCGAFELCRSTVDSEHNWVLLSAIASLATRARGPSHDQQDGPDDLSGDGPRKRQKRQSIVSETIAESRSGVGVYALQSLAFLASDAQLTANILEDLIESMMVVINSAGATASSWAMLVLSECACRQELKTHRLWMDVWRSAMRLMSSSQHSRAACHLLCVLLNTATVAFEDVSASLNGFANRKGQSLPALMTDSSLSLFMETLFKFSQHSPSITAVNCLQGMCEWIVAKWTPSGFDNRQYAAQCYGSFSVVDLIPFTELLRGSVDETIPPPYKRLLDLGQAFDEQTNSLELVQYLLGTGDGDVLSHSKSINRKATRAIHLQVSSTTRESMVKTFASHLSSEAEKVSETWTEIYQPGSKSISRESFMVASCFAIITDLLVSASASSDTLDDLRQRQADLMKRIRAVFESIDAGVEVREVLCEGIWATLSGIRDAAATLLTRETVEIFVRALDHQHRLVNMQKEENKSDSDMDDLEFESQRESSQQKHLGSDSVRNHAAASGGTASFDACTRAQLILVKDAMDTEDGAFFLSDAFVLSILDFDTDDFLSLRPLFCLLEQTQAAFNASSALALLKEIGVAYLQVYDMRLSDSAISLCVQILKMTVPLWSTAENASLEDTAQSFYQWLLRAILEEGKTSAAVQSDMSAMLLHMLQHTEVSADQLRVASIQGSILAILKQAKIPVQLTIAETISALFVTKPQREHESLLSEITEKLPSYTDWIEGIAMRLFTFAKLAEAQPSILPGCIFRIVEATGNAPDVSKQASHCMNRIARSLAFSSAAELLDIFGENVTLVWQSHRQAITDFPFQVFGFPNVTAFLQATYPFVAGTAFSQELSDNRIALREALGRSEKDVLLETLPTSAACAFARDFAGPASKGPIHTAENVLTSVLGRQDFAIKLWETFPYILGSMFVHLDAEDSIKKAFARHKGFEAASTIYSSLSALDTNADYLPLNLEPCFKASTLIDQISRLERRLGGAQLSVWSPSTVVVVARAIFDSAHAALGPLYLRLVLRKIRVLLALAGKACLKGYTLECLVHGVRPLVSNPHCARDASLIFKYLLDNGSAHLQSQPSFVAGTCLALSLEARSLVSLSGRETIDHQAFDAAEFTDWMNKWIETTETACLSSVTTTKSFKHLMRISRQSLGNGSSIASTREGQLLQVILTDMGSATKTLTRPFVDHVLPLLCGDGFKRASALKYDILNTPRLASMYATSVWQSCHIPGMSRAYLSWAAKCLGSSFGYQGKVPSVISAESDIREKKMTAVVQNELISSGVAILRCFAEALHDRDSKTVSIAEKTLAKLLAIYGGSEDGVLLQQCLGPDISEGLLLDKNMAPPQGLIQTLSGDVQEVFKEMRTLSPGAFAQQLVLALINAARGDVFLRQLETAVRCQQSLGQRLLPFVLHLALSERRSTGSDLTLRVSAGFNSCFEKVEDDTLEHVRILIDAFLYLRTRTASGETTKFQRNYWVEIDFRNASIAALKCSMFKSALLFAEIDHSAPTPPSSGRRSSQQVNEIPYDFLLSLFRRIDDPDAFHGVPREPSVDAVVDRLAFEGSGRGELLMRGARTDSLLKAGMRPDSGMLEGMIGSLTNLNMSNLAVQMYKSGDMPANTGSITESMTRAAIKLRQWDLDVPKADESDIGALHSVLQVVSNDLPGDDLQFSIDSGAVSIFKRALRPGTAVQSLRSAFSTLAAFSDIDEATASRGPEELFDVIKKLRERKSWLTTNPSEDASMILLGQEAFYGALAGNGDLRDLMQVDEATALVTDVNLNLEMSIIHRERDALQESLATVSYLSERIELCNDAGLSTSAAIRYETANVLWSQGELIPSIRILKDLEDLNTLDKQSVPVNRAALLATLGNHVSEARLEKPDEIMRKYLTHSVRALRDRGEDIGQDAGRVYHEFATYCHKQLTNQESLDDLQRSESSKAKRRDEIAGLDAILKTRLDEQSKHRARSERNKAKKWYDIDKAETERLARNREQFLRQSLDGYLHSLAASDEHDTDVLRFLALWLEHAANSAANESVARISKVPSLKFAPLMNQLASRLQDSDDPFHSSLLQLVERICMEHPFHGIYHIYAGSRTSGGNDRTAISRNAAATKLVTRLAASKKTSELWKRVVRANDLYIQLAIARSESFKAGARIVLRKVSASKTMERDVPQLGVPPITLNIPLRSDGNYQETAVVEGFKPEMSIAGGLSAPKVITAIASDGTQCKQLLKAGADDLRQDAIMEQVFEQVSDLLQTQKETRQRSLQIRTYKVIPLDATSGAIEFVQNTQPLNDYLRGAHLRYHPKDYRWDDCRNKVDEVRSKAAETRVAAYQKIAQNFHPVLRHFFFERFDDPDDWFARRLAYTRSTAAISILGHALGLGDRHCQNILLDTQSGEVVHIDLGVAFEAGRILAVPEVVPFRLTRDIVDGFGIMGVEGVFRRCCEFTLEALRANRDAIMTLLNVLRYDPLYSWSMSPLRARRLREEQDREEEMPATGRTNNDGGAGHKVMAVGSTLAAAPDESGEADRALGVVERKLGPGLSVMATVNELIVQATDERNLAVLFCGWAAFA